MALLLSAACLPARADDAASQAQPWRPMLLAAQYNGIQQHLDSFTSPYAGPLSLPASGDDELSQTAGVYFGMVLSSRWQSYLDVERFVGGGVGNATGLASPSDGDVVRGGSGLPKDAYIARAYVQYLLPLADGYTAVDRAQDQLPGQVAIHAFLFKAGKLAVGDDFDQNRYANNTRTQFESWTLINDGAYDYAADTRGYTDGLVFGYLQSAWAIKFGVYRMSQRANEEALAWPLTRAHGDNLELDLMPWTSGAVLRLLVYRNVAAMGDYQQAIDQSLAGGGVPDVAATRIQGRQKRGFGLNLEEPLADEGETGLSLRLGWNDGHTESFEFTEVDRTLSVGGQLSGAHWGQEDDRLGLATVINAISAVHRRYLERGGCGFELCDGRLDYGYESVIEAYYRWQAGPHVQISPDVQFVENPGYNRDRGPARIYGLRLHLQY